MLPENARRRAGRIIADTRLILYTGKGGVGKTTVAAATALMTAGGGHRTLVISTDAAHSLSDTLEVDVGPEPTRVDERLWSQEIDPLHEMERSWGLIQDYLRRLLDFHKLDGVTAEELTVFPGMEELFSLLRIRSHVSTGEYDVVIVDCAPTGETLRLLSYPDVFRWWMERLFPMQRQAMRAIRPVARSLVKIPLPEDGVFESVEFLFNEVLATQALLSDPDTSTVRLVVNPERVVLKEAQRSFTYLHLFGVKVDAVIMNRVIPREVTDSFFERWKSDQEGHRRSAEEYFAPVPVFAVPLFDAEISGRTRLRELAGVCYGERDPVEAFYEGWPQALSREGDGYRLSIPLPSVEKSEVSLSRRRDELTVRVGGRKRTIVLPRVLRKFKAEGAKFEGDCLNIRFGGDEGGRNPEP